MEKENKINYGLLAAALTMLLFGLIFYFSGRFPGGKDLFLYSDLRVQYIAFAKLFLRSLLSGEGIGYTFYASMGMPSIPLYTYYSLSPFNILYLLIDHAEIASIVLVALKLALAAYTFQRFSAGILKNDSLSSVVFSVGYALNGYCIIYYFNIILLDGVYMLPVIAMLLWEAVKEHRFVKLTLAYAYLFVVQFYEGYIIGFFTLLLFVLLMIVEYKKEWKNYVSVLVGFCGSVLVAALIGAAFLYPTAVYLLTNIDNGAISEWMFECNILDIYKNLFMGQYQSIGSPYPYIYCGVMILYLVPCFFLNHRVKKEHKLIAIVLLGYLILCSLWLPGYMFMHCFDVPDGFGFRFAYLYSFVLLAIGCAEWKYMDSKYTWKYSVLLLLHIAGYFLLNSREEHITMLDKVSNTVFLVIFFIIIMLFKKCREKKWYQWLLLGAVCIELVVSGVLTIGKIEQDIWFQRDIYQAFTTVNRRAIDEIKTYDQGVYRIVQENPYDYNDGIMNEYYGTVYFSSIGNTRLKDTLRYLGYAVSPRVISDNGGTSFTKMIFSQKYSVTVNSADYIQGRSERLWMANDNVLSLGFMAADTILDITLNSDNTFENQNSVASGLTGQDIRIFIPYLGEVSGKTDNMTVVWDGEYYIMEPKDRLSEGSLVFKLEDDVMLPAYAYLVQDESLNSKDSYYFISGEEDQMRILIPAAVSFPQIIKLAKDAEEKYFIGIYYDIYHSTNNFYRDIYFYCYDDVSVSRVYELLKDNQMNILEMNGSNIIAEIDVPSDKPILFTSIPYDEGWHVLVDGQEAPALAVMDDTFLAVELTEGHHELKFYYDSAVNRIGVIFSICGIILWFGLLFDEKRNMHKSAVKEHSKV